MKTKLKTMVGTPNAAFIVAAYDISSIPIIPIISVFCS